MYTFLDLSSTACPAVESEVFGDGAKPLSNEWLDPMEKLLLYFKWTLQSKDIGKQAINQYNIIYTCIYTYMDFMEYTHVHVYAWHFIEWHLVRKWSLMVRCGPYTSPGVD